VNAAKLTGMLSQLPVNQLMMTVNDEDLMRIRFHDAMKQLKDANKWTEVEDSQSSNASPDDAPLFFRPSSTQRYYCPDPGRATSERLNIFRNVGRVLGLSLLHNELCPIPLSRPVVKQILGRKVNWHDLAFYDSALFESLRKLVLAAQTEPETVEEMDLTFEIDDSTAEGATQLRELVPGGSNMKVTRHNIYNYVRRYANYKMVTKLQPAVKELRKGVYDVISEQSLNGLTPEDWWLLVNGVGTVDVSKLSAITTFNDESNSKDEGDKSDVQRLQKWFWEVVETFSQNERQELLYFWTGAPALRAGEEAFEPAPSVTIRHPNDQSLPSANTCISRLYLPLYSNKTILRSKLLMAIKTKTFGFV
jgi:E3 ubiquitin-protein ligase EDD1